MKILTLSLALFLTFLPESTPNVFFSQGGQQEVCWEEADELEEEAILRIPLRLQKRMLPPSLTHLGNVVSVPVHKSTELTIQLFFERQWLTCRRLRL